MFAGIIIIAILLAGFVVLLRQAGSARQRCDLLPEEVLKQAGIPLLRGDDEQQLAERVRAYLCAQPPEAAA